MEGNQMMQPHHRLLLAAALFAVIAIGVFVLVWKWPDLFKKDRVADDQFVPVTEEEKEDIRAQLRAAMEAEQAQNPGEPEERQEIREQLAPESSGGSESDVPEEEKNDIRDQLRAQMQTP